jgi:hypothetical protein
MELLAAHCPHLQYLDVSMSEEITARGVHAVATGCPQLSSLDLGDRDDDGDVLQALTAACPLPRLKHLELGSTWIRDDVLLELARACPQLQSLGLNSCQIHG